MTKMQALLLETARGVYTLLPHHNQRLMDAIESWEAELVSVEHESGVAQVPTVETPTDAT